MRSVACGNASFSPCFMMPFDDKGLNGSNQNIKSTTLVLLIDHIKTRGFVVWKEALQQAVWARNDLFIEQLVNASTPEIVAEVWRETQKRYPESGLQPFYQAQCERQALSQAVEHIVAAPHRSGARKL